MESRVEALFEERFNVPMNKISEHRIEMDPFNGSRIVLYRDHRVASEHLSLDVGEEPEQEKLEFKNWYMWCLYKFIHFH